MIRSMAAAPRVVGIAHADDGWAAACLAIAGRVPVWACEASPARAEAHLRALGLPGLGTEAVEATLGADLRLQDVQGPSKAGSLPAAEGPLVTILVCTYNRVDLLPEAISSARAQSWPCEVVVVNDGSTDGTREWLDAQDGLRVFHQENTGKPGALNRGLSEARGEAVLVLDDDDLIFPGAVQVLAKALFDHPERAAVWGDTGVFEGDAGRIREYLPSCRLPGEMARTGTLLQVPAATGATLIRMSAQREAGAYDPRMIRGEDMDMFQRLSRVGPIEAVPYPTFLCRAHAGLRGSAATRWDKNDQKKDHERFCVYAVPVFLERWKAWAPKANRMEGFAWAMGLQERDCRAEARQELERWSAPFSLSEAWMRGHVGLASPAHNPPEAVVVVDEGDPGALEETLLFHADRRSIWVNLEVPRDPLGNTRLYWQGQYGAQQRLHAWVEHNGPVHLRLTAAPDWAPPPIPTVDLLPDLPASDAVLALAAVLGWDPPRNSRRGLDRPMPESVERIWRVRFLLERERADLAAGLLPALSQALPDWHGTWRLAARTWRALGREELARPWEERLARLAA